MLESIYKNNISELLHHSEWKLLRSGNGCPLPRVHVHSVCVFTTHCCVCALGWVKCRSPISSMGHHTWQYITFFFFYQIINLILLNMNLFLLFQAYDIYLQQTIMRLVTWAVHSRVRRITELASPMWINHHSNPWVLSLRCHAIYFYICPHEKQLPSE